MAEITPPRPLREDDDLDRFDCGRESLNTWLRRHAWWNQAADVSRTSVICGARTGAVAGYAALSAAQIEREHLPKSAQRNRPDPIPVILLGQLAVDKGHQGQGHARSLLFFALKTALFASQHIGSLGVVTHPIDDGVRAFYRRWGFEELPFDPGRAMIVRMADLKRSGFSD